MSTGKIASWAFAEEFVSEDSLFDRPGVVERARERAAELGSSSPLPGEGSVLRLLAATADAKAVVELGTGTGVGSLYLLSGMNPQGVLTTIDTEVENHRAAREAFDEAGIRPAAARTIAGNPGDVISRLTDNAYDMVVFPADGVDPVDLLEHAARLLRPGGVLAMTHALFHDRVADPADRKPTTSRIRAFYKEITASSQWVPALLPSGDGVFAAIYRPQ